MRVKKNCLVRVDYRVTDADGNEIDASLPGYPLEFVAGRGDVIYGLERGVLGLDKGARTKLVIPPDKAYGPHNPDHVKTLPRAAFPSNMELKIGASFSYRTDKGAEVMYRVTEIGDDTIVADYNHPMAGKTLHYEVTIVDVTKDWVTGKIEKPR